MSGIGSYSWLNDYIGIPYKFGGRDENGCDCFGLIKLIYLREYEEVLPDWAFDELNLKAINREIAQQVNSGSFEEIDHPEDGCFAVCYRTKAAHHMGLYYGGGIIHCVDGTGTVYQTRSKFESLFNKIVYGHWNP